MNDLDLTVVIPTIAERAPLLAEALASLEAQTLKVPHYTCYDPERYGPANVVNRLVEQVKTKWFFRLDDDDLLDPDHFEVLSHWLDDDADIVFTWCRIEGGGELHPPEQFQVRLQDEFGWEHLREQNWIPCSAAIRTSLFHDLGGFREVPEEDWDFWQRALDHGATFSCVPTVTWTYRMNPEWSHRSLEAAA